MKNTLLAGLAAGIMALGMTEAASAVSIFDIQLNGQYADAVAGPLSDPNSDNSDILNALTGAFAGNNWTYLTKDDFPGNDDSGKNGSGSWGGIDFLLSTTAGKIGTWDLSWSGNLPAQMDLVAVIKGSPVFAAYMFDNEVLAAAGSNTPNDPWQITFTNGGGQIPDLSYIALYIRDVVDLQSPAPAPEPATMLLFATGIVGLIGVRRKQKT
ncbi:MAG: hypothetical protein A2505_06680 [Deltaproteobacteria bacterium RIFOXYD12_FULL_55_16]|nr:MAG: hypothetical protein A2505_06680 [Deltaproteobacteria bacterium RIFOXYD12_FULL_55_16]